MTSSLPEGEYYTTPKVKETTYVLDYCPVKPGTLKINLGGKPYKDDGKGKIVSDHGMPHEIGRIDYDTGRIVFDSYFVFAYEYDTGEPR